MKNWIPIPGTKKEALLKVAIEEFKHKAFPDVNINELAKKADMTTGAVYHHFGSKINLYTTIREEMEQRLIDRMEGAASLFETSIEKMSAAMTTNLPFVYEQNFCLLLGSNHPEGKEGKVDQYIGSLQNGTDLPLDVILLPAWRSVLLRLHQEEITMEQAQNLIQWLFRKGEKGN
ncbi:TetR/AcrR family transcriptional regulator [Alkalicoccobacillus murimartini]|uniref:AcrR family transcriptional regulator n=1 Tax=Alkalicoccobacillus murimartini TaxID=171685 RepID=A0ABT9YHV3_9BACI|nr:TetR/AcrR family transcriptional regulator [Alkalicoccobacillus murimartini]MDQ0207441.1 AcrR family transcriptional regulator [Alkalicoccobacillus murimartini]